MPEAPFGRPLDTRTVGVDEVDHEHVREEGIRVNAHGDATAYRERLGMREVRILVLRDNE